MSMQMAYCLQMWSCKKRASGKGSVDISCRELKERQGAVNKDEVLRISMFDACRSTYCGE